MLTYEQPTIIRTNDGPTLLVPGRVRLSPRDVKAPCGHFVQPDDRYCGRCGHKTQRGA